MEIKKNEITINSQDILEYAKDFCNSLGLELENISHLQFKAVCLAIGQHFFNDNTAILYINNNKNNGIDYSKLLALYNVYNSMCLMYDKIPNVLAYSYFINLDYKYLYNCMYENTGEKASLYCGELLQKLSTIREDGLKDRAIDKGGAVGVAIVGNSEYCWNAPGSRPIQANNNNSCALPEFNNNKALTTL